MSNMPGGPTARRPLHFYWICDCSASMSLDGKIESLNTAVRECLPQMRQVASNNPAAEVLLRTLRFSSGARWVQPDPIPLEHFYWEDLRADELPFTAEFASEFRRRLDREGAQSGDVQASLIWNNYNDLDLHVVAPSGEEIFFGHKRSACGGELDVDMNVSPTSTEPVENIFWPTGGAPAGVYRIFVNHYRNHGLQGCQDPTPFKVAVNVGGAVNEFDGYIRFGEPKKLVYEFNLDPSAIAGSATGGGGNTDLGAGLTLLADQLRIPPMSQRALPPVLVLISDGAPTDDYQQGIAALMNQPWGVKSIRLAIAIGRDVDNDVLNEFINHSELEPLQANNPEALVTYIRWASTAVLKRASQPQTAVAGQQGRDVDFGTIPQVGSPDVSVDDVW